MPARGDQCNLVRLVRGVRGKVAMEMDLVLRFDYGASVPWVTRTHDGLALRAVAGPDMVVLRTPARLEGEDLATVSRFEVAAGETVPFVLSHRASHLEPPQALDAERALRDTEAFWREWAGRCTVEGDLAPIVRRSLITLKALIYAPTGGIVAAPTTSLPEMIGFHECRLLRRGARLA
jgi:GH15 family glucan-1,4-alpha-glucosidase